jgi:hypothetical protein
VGVFFFSLQISWALPLEKISFQNITSTFCTASMKKVQLTRDKQKERWCVLPEIGESGIVQLEDTGRGEIAAIGNRVDVVAVAVAAVAVAERW